MTLLASWTDDRVSRLKALWKDGLSASQIAAELGDVTRNGVIGKVHRLGLSGRPKKGGLASTKPRQRRLQLGKTVYVTPVVSRVATALARACEVEAEPAPIVHDNVIPLHQRVSLMELSDAVCHWPVGDPLQPDFHFCGGKALAGFPYCAHHSRVAYQPASDRRRKPGPKPSASRTGAWV